MPRTVSQLDIYNRLRMQALVLLGIAVFLGGIVSSWYVLSLPYAGFEFVGPSSIGSVHAGSPAEIAGLRPGDKILGFDDEYLWPGMAFLQPGKESLSIAVERDGAVRSIDLTLRPPSLRESLHLANHYLVALGFWALGMAVLFFKPNEAIAQMIAVLSLLAATAIIVWPLSALDIAWANILMSTVVLALGPIFVHLHMMFPERNEFRQRRMLLKIVYGTGVALWLLSTGLDLLYYLRLAQGSSDLISLTPVVEAHFVICILVGLALLGRTERVTKSEASKRSVSLVLLGMAMALLPFVTSIALPQILSVPYTVPTWLPLFLLLLIPLSYAYALFRDRLLDHDGIINRSVVYYLLSLSLLTLYLGLSLGVGKLVPELFSGPMAAGNILLVLGLALVLGPLRSGIQRIVDRAFYGGWYDYETLISETSTALQDATGFSAIADLLVNKVADLMFFRTGALILPDQDESWYTQQSKGFPATLNLTWLDELIEHISRTAKPVTSDGLKLGTTLNSSAAAELGAWVEAGAQIWVPLIEQGRITGLLVYGGKAAGDFFYPKDFRMLSTLSQQAALALARVRLVEKLRNQVHEVQSLARQVMALQERNQQQMAQEIHARLLQDLAMAEVFLSDAQAKFLPEEVRSARDVLNEVSTYLRTILFELQPPAWETSDLQTILKDYIQSVQRRRGLPVSLDVQTNGQPKEIPETIRIAVFRILQESLNNVRKHADATQILVTLDLRPKRVTLQVVDNGVGFSVPTQLSTQVDRGHLGLMSMREWAAGIGGVLQIESATGQGTRVCLDVQLDG